MKGALVDEGRIKLGDVRTARSTNRSGFGSRDEPWVHISEEHSELAGHLFDVLETIEQPDSIFEGNMGSC